ncbi:MAG: hypothetical protein KF814_05470 [Nitrospiraceae bacterium]|nr:hypothetical protein [Nitrospiraceae bacterium]
MPGEANDSQTSTIGVVLFSSAMQLRYANKVAGDMLAVAGLKRRDVLDRQSFLFKLILLGSRVREQWWGKVEDLVDVDPAADPLLPVRRFRLTGMAVHSVDEGDRDFQILVLMQADGGMAPRPLADLDQQVEPLPLAPSSSC